jgi:hypothetical protein
MRCALIGKRRDVETTDKRSTRMAMIALFQPVTALACSIQIVDPKSHVAAAAFTQRSRGVYFPRRPTTAITKPVAQVFVCEAELCAQRKAETKSQIPSATFANRAAESPRRVAGAAESARLGP